MFSIPMIPFLTYPLAMIALATVPALAAIYILRNRFRRRPVSSLVLWRFHVQSKSGGAKIHRLQLPLLFFLELLALLLLVTAATGPHWKLPQSARPLIVVLDDSFSMRADTRRRFSAGPREEFFGKTFPPPAAAVHAADSRRHANRVHSARPRKTGATWTNCCRNGNAGRRTRRLDRAVTLASELGKQQANILVLTDHKPAEEKITGQRLEWHAFGSPEDNVAIVNASRTAFGDQDRCLLEIANFSGAAHTTKLAVQTGTNAAQGSLVSLGAHESQRVVFNIPSSASALRATLEPDALTEDNEVQLLPPIRKHVRVQVALTNENSAALLNRTLGATGLRAAISENPELVVSENDAVAGTNSWSLRWSSAGATNAYTGPFIVDNSHPLASGIALEGVVWAAAALTNAPGEVPVILAGNVPLLSAREDVLGRRHLALNLNPGLSTVQNTPDWPILFWNILTWRISEMPGFQESNARLGTEVILKTTGEAVTITQPDGAKKSFPRTGGELALETPMPGIYSVEVSGPGFQPVSSSDSLFTNKEHTGKMPVPLQFSVNVLTADKSDLSACATGHWGQWSEDTERRLEEASAVWIFGLLALGLLCAHLFLVANGKGAM